MKRPLSSLHDLLRSRSGNVTMTFGLAMPVLFMASAAALDYGSYQSERAHLQAQTDAAAIASARELQMAKADPDKIAAVAQSFIHN
jgi:Flp pilus assembly protein TadG